jgi:hypothetical protein
MSNPNDIVIVNVTTQSPPIPSLLLRMGAIISQGATTLTPGSYQALTSSSDLAAILTGSVAITAMTWLASVVTVTLATAQTGSWSTDDIVRVTIAGAAPTAYNGTYNATVVDSTHFTFPLAANPGAATTLGTMTLEDVAEITAQNTTFWNQGTNTLCYVLELGEGSTSDGVTALINFIAGNPSQIFAHYLVPRTWDGEATFKTLASQYVSNNAMTWFHVTTTTATYTAWQTLAQKSVFGYVEYSEIPATEFDAAIGFYTVLTWNPSSSQKVPPLCFTYALSSTAYPILGNGALLTSLKAAGVNYIAPPGGGLTYNMLVWGKTMDGKSYNYWYAIAWMIVNSALNISNLTIQGSNDNTNPLYYSQDGIDRLQNSLVKLANAGISYGLILGSVQKTKLTQAVFAANVNDGDYAGSCAVNAVPFASYTSLNQSDYMLMQYKGLTVVFTPQLGFESITINLVASLYAG